jgi:uncharacterized membrane protein YdjX (TVP38/TMEM64 family)
MKKFVATLIGWGLPGLFLAALLDGAGLTIPGGVDILVVVLAAARPDDVLLLSFVTVLGSVLGNFFLFSIARKGGQMFLEKRLASKRSQTFKAWFDRYGLLTVFISALVPLPVMPMKIFVFCSGALGISPIRFVLAFLGARIPRYLGLAYLGRNMGDNAMGYLRSHVWHLTAFAAVLFLLLWLVIRVADMRREKELNSRSA